MTKKKRTIKDVDAGLRELIFVFHSYLEMKGDLPEFNNHMAEKKRKFQEKMKEQDGNTD